MSELQSVGYQVRKNLNYCILIIIKRQLLMLRDKLHLNSL